MTFYVTPRSVETLLRLSRFSVLSDEFPQVYANGNMFYPCEIENWRGSLSRHGLLRNVPRQRPAPLFRGDWKRDYLLADRIVDEPGHGMQSKFDHDSRPVRLDGSDCNSQTGSNHLIRFPLCQKLNNFNFAGSWPGLCQLRRVGLISILEKPLQHDLGYSGSQEEPTRRDILHSLNEVCCKIGFQYVPKGSCVQNPAHHLVGLMHGENYYFCVWTCIANLARG